jgi:RNA polymerase sigma-70 factor (ECF subfamily)
MLNTEPADVLLMRARAGCRESLGRLFELYRQHLDLLAATQLNGRLRSRLNPSDLVQETFLQASRHFEGFRGETEEELVSWLRSILRRCLLRAVQKQIVARRRSLLLEVGLPGGRSAGTDFRPASADDFVSPGSSPSTPAQRRELTALLGRQLAQLPAPFREVIVLRNLEGRSFPEIARQMKRTPGAVRVLWLRALARLRQLSAERPGNESGSCGT